MVAGGGGGGGERLLMSTAPPLGRMRMSWAREKGQVNSTVTVLNAPLNFAL